MDELMEIGVMTTPVTVIDGEVMVGFNRKQLEVLLASQPCEPTIPTANLAGEIWKIYW